MTNLAIIGPTFTGSAASLRAAVETMLSKHSTSPNQPAIESVSISGTTSTKLAIDQLNSAGASSVSIRSDTSRQALPKIEYRSFSYDGTYAQNRLLALSACKDVAFLIEDGTAFSRAATNALTPTSPSVPCLPHVILFPREISLLRNAQAEQGGGEVPNPTGSAPSPYLHLSLKDSNSYDSVPHLSREITPLSQEAQLMAIARRLQLYGSQYIIIAGSNVLDQLFLAQFLHRACPDARLTFYAGDLLFEREIDNVPFIGTITFTPYPLISASSSSRVYSDSNTQAYYNAAFYAISSIGSPDMKHPQMQVRTSLWVTAIGRDGYYPLGFASAQEFHPMPVAASPARLWFFLCILVCLVCASHGALLCVADYWSPFTRELAVKENDQPRRRAMYIHIATAMLFCLACVLAIPLFPTFRFCLRDPAAVSLSRLTPGMGFAAVAVTFWKTRKYIGWTAFPTTLDLNNVSKKKLARWLTERDPENRGTSYQALQHYAHQAVVIDQYRIRHEGKIDSIDKLETVTTRGVISGLKQNATGIGRLFLFFEQNVYFFFNLIAWFVLLAVPLLWRHLCYTDNAGGLERDVSNVGLFFSFRCVHPGSGVSPIVPVLLLLLSWYLWAVFHTLRLRFSENCRPILPSRLALTSSYPLFVADEDLGECDSARCVCLYKNLSCLLITREAIRRFLRTLIPDFERRGRPLLDVALVLLYLVAFALFALYIPVRSLDALFWNSGYLPTPYEFLVIALFFPLLVTAVTGWLRLIFVWGALKRGLLDRLENLPIRFAFSRLKGAGWMGMLRQGGLHEQWRDMARSTESMRQMVNDPDLNACIRESTDAGNPAHLMLAPANGSINALKDINDRLNLYIGALLAHRNGTRPKARILEDVRHLSKRKDLPVRGNIDLILMHAIERIYAEFSEVLLERVLIPYWKAKRSELVEGEEAEAIPADENSKKASKAPPAKSEDDTPTYVRVAEEFLAIRYLSLIRAVLVNVRHLIVFVSLSFVLAIVAWNSYPFEPRQIIDWIFTGMLAVLGCGVIWVFAQMHRDAILSRITHTSANELGAEFYIRIVAFGAVPVLTWLAYQFPDVGNTIFKFLQPGIEVVK